eukprot:1141672-Pelagomonas_calceolata.AAC.2
MGVTLKSENPPKHACPTRGLRQLEQESSWNRRSPCVWEALMSCPRSEGEVSTGRREVNGLLRGREAK